MRIRPDRKRDHRLCRPSGSPTALQGSPERSQSHLLSTIATLVVARVRSSTCPCSNRYSEFSAPAPPRSMTNSARSPPGARQSVTKQRPPRNAYQCSDDRWVAISASATSIARRVLQLVGIPRSPKRHGSRTPGERAQRADLLDKLVGEWIAARPFETVVEAFTNAGAAIAPPIYDVEQLVNDPHVRQRESVITCKDEDLGPLQMQNVFFRMSKTPPGSVQHTGRRLGQDNDDVFAELGVDRITMDRLRQDGTM